MDRFVIRRPRPSSPGSSDISDEGPRVSKWPHAISYK